MKLFKKLKQVNREFQGQYQCEFCNAIQTDSGLESMDMPFYLECIVPAKKCHICLRRAVEITEIPVTEKEIFKNLFQQ